MHAFMDKGLEIWTRKFIARSIWRFHGEYDDGDLFSEAWLVFNRVYKKYGNIAIRHFMAIYKIALLNQFHRLASRNRYRENFIDIGEVGDFEISRNSILDILVEAPPEIRDAIVALMEVSPTLLTDHPSARRETLDQRFHRIIDGAPDDIATRIKNFLHDVEYAKH